jgi:hypothetical protein
VPCATLAAPRIRAGQKNAHPVRWREIRPTPVAYNPEMRHKASAGPPLQWRLAVLRWLSSVALAEHRRGPRRLRHRRPAVRRQHSRGGGEARYNRRQRTQTDTCQAGRAPGLAARLSGFLVSVVLLSPAIAAAQEWPTYGGDPGGRRFSNATQITPDNVARLTPAWTFHTGERPRPPIRARESMSVLRRMPKMRQTAALVAPSSSRAGHAILWRATVVADAVEPFGQDVPNELAWCERHHAISRPFGVAIVLVAKGRNFTGWEEPKPAGRC